MMENAAAPRWPAAGGWLVLERAWAAAVAVILAIELWSDPVGEPGRTVILTALGLLAAGSLAFVRRHPGRAFAVNAAAVFGLILVGGPSNVYQYTNLAALYSVAAATGAARHQGRADLASWWASSGPSWAALAVGLSGVALYFRRFPDEGGRSILAMALLLWFSAWLLGRVHGARRAEVALRAERDLSAELAEARRLRLELEAERGEMARELHDIVGHTLNVMLIHAGAARRAVVDDPDGAVEALTIIETTGRTAMDDLDRVLGLLGRGDGAEADRRPLPGLDDLPALVATVAEGGRAAVTLSVDDTLDASSVSKARQLAAYRVVQEALTNVLKHAEARSVRVAVRGRGDDLVVTVDDDGRGLDRAGVDARPGRGLAGMTERARLHGGTLDVTDAEPGTLVTLTLPRGRT